MSTSPTTFVERWRADLESPRVWLPLLAVALGSAAVLHYSASLWWLLAGVMLSAFRVVEPDEPRAWAKLAGSFLACAILALIGVFCAVTLDRPDMFF